jgi:predicted CoA-substrate-specific enzyme activase
MQKKVYMGIDVGSVSTNIVLIDANDIGKIYESLYVRTDGQPLEVVKQGLSGLKQRGYENNNIMGVGITGSARALIGNIVGADIIKNEITAHAVAAITQIPDVKTVLEIGGQDSKIIIIRDKVVTDLAMNSVCAAGTGSFLDQQAFRLKIPIEEFGDYALKAESSVRIAGRCTVFAESDMIHKQQLGFGKEEIIAGLCEALVRNYINNVAKGKSIESPVLFQGGVAFNHGIKAAFEKELEQELIIPDNFNVMGAIGSAILAREMIHETKTSTIFRGFDISKQKVKVRLIYCEDCSNNCELTQASVNEECLSVWGDRCGKWQS